ncbi:hypothetical protein EQG41_18190 [Billgrantia azerbaijanica]|nr:hypothetical protein EQG41_18190 [Halomonas azerbaijanica]
MIKRRTIAELACTRRDSITADAENAVRMAIRKAEASGRRYGIFAHGHGLFRVRRVYGNPRRALEIVTPSWDYHKDYREMEA